MFSWRQRSVLIIIFVLMLLTLAPYLHIANAIACNGDCTLYPGNCNAGLSCVSNVCKPPIPSCTGGYPQVDFTNSTSGTFSVYATGVQNATSVTFPTWSSINGQDDLVTPWYQGTNSGGGLWTRAFNLSNHSAGAGTINSHIYMNNCGYTNVWCGTANFVIDTTAPTCSISGPTTSCTGASATYTSNGTDTYLSQTELYKSPTSSQSWTRFCTAAGDCTAATTFPSAGTYYAVCNAYDSAGNQCSGNPFGLPPGWSDCGPSDYLTVTVTNPPAYVACPTACGSPASNQPDGTCGGTHYCAAVTDTTAPPVPDVTVSTANCSNSMSFSWPAVVDTGCWSSNGVSYYKWIRDNGVDVYKNWQASTSYAIAAPVVGHVYEAAIRSGDTDGSGNHPNISAWNTTYWIAGGEPYCCKATAAALAPLTITPNVSCNGPSFPNIYNWKADPNASGYVLNIPGCLTNQVVAGGGADSSISYTLTSVQRTTCATNKATGSVSWNVQATYDGGCSNSAVASSSFFFDKDAPSQPIPVITPIADDTCWGRYKLQYTWGASTDVGCGNSSIVYQSQASSVNNTFPVPNEFPDNTWGGALTQTSNPYPGSYVPGTRVYTHAASRDALGNTLGYSGPESTTIPVPSPYPTIHIEGSFSEKVNSTCTDKITLDDAPSLTINPVLNPNTGATVSCSNDAQSYSCNITINNITGLCVVPNTTLTLNASYPGYSSVEWHNGETCMGLSKLSWNLNVGDNKIKIPLFFQYSGGDGAGGGWFKLSRTSFNSRMNDRPNYLPNSMTPYDDVDDPGASKYMIIDSSAGNVIQNGAVVIGSASTKYSEKNWQTTGYQNTNDITYAKYIDYMKARKDFTTITLLPLSSSSFPTDGIYSIAQDVTLDPTWFDGKNIVLVIQAGKKALFTGTDFITTGSLAVLAPTIEIEASVTQINAILIGQTVSTGTVPNSNPLKIVGNLIDEEVDGLTIGRSRTDSSKPTLFVVFDANMYFNVLPYLSTSTYDWRQIQ